MQAANAVQLHTVYANGTEAIITIPDLSNARYIVYFSIVPYHGDDPNFPTKFQRDPLTLYPYWHIRFYFNQTIAGNSGVQVGVWGDTKEIIFANGFGSFGPSTSNNSPGGQEIAQASETQPSFCINVLAVAAFSIIVVSIMANCNPKQAKKSLTLYLFFFYENFLLFLTQLATV